MVAPEADDSSASSFDPLVAVQEENVNEVAVKGDGIVVDEDEPVKLLGEIVAGYQLQQSGREDVNEDEVAPFCIVKLGHDIIHKTKKSEQRGSNPVWTVSTHSLFLFETTPLDLAGQNLHFSLWFKRKDPLRLTTIDTCFLGKASIPSSDLLSQLNEERIEVDLLDEGGKSTTGKLTVRFRVAAPSDEAFLRYLQDPLGFTVENQVEANDKCSVVNERTLVAESAMPTSSKPPAPLVTETDETQVAGANFVKSISAAFTSRSYFDRDLGETKVLVKPFPDPDRVADTTYLSPTAIKEETMKPSKQWIEAGSGTLGKLYLEILSCKGLPNVDVGESVGNLTDCFMSCGASLLAQGGGPRYRVAHMFLSPTLFE